MSFTMVVKDEASKIETTRLEDISELSAIIRIAGNINNNIKSTTDNFNNQSSTENNIMQNEPNFFL